MALLQVVPRFVEGGAEALALGLHLALLKAGLPSSLLSLSGPPIDVAGCTALGARHPRDPVACWRLRRWLHSPQGAQVKVIHTHLFPDQVWTPLALKGLDIQPTLITTLHSLGTGRDALPFGVSLDRWIYRPYQRLICVSQQVADACSRRLPELEKRLEGEPAEFGKNRTLTVQASRPRLTVAC
jgi:hypothetical protein